MSQNLNFWWILKSIDKVYWTNLIFGLKEIVFSTYLIEIDDEFIYAINLLT